MSELTDKELLEALGVEEISSKKKKFNKYEERLIQGFNEIQNFFEEFNRLPENKINKSIFERLYYVRLEKLISTPENRSLLKEFDRNNLLSFDIKNEQNITNENISDLELLNSFGIDSQNEDFLNLKFVRGSEERKIAEEIAKREKCQNFDEFKEKFNDLQAELKRGKRKTIAINKRPEIKKGQFYILSGQKTFVAEVGSFFMQEYGIKDARLHLIFDNGTESRMLMCSFQKALTLDATARIISDKSLGPLFSNQINPDDEHDGILYVLRSKSNHPYIVQNRDLIHKIGYTTGSIDKRISKAKMDPTFLMAEVEIVDSYKLYNIKSSKFENLVQKIFSTSKLRIEILDRFGNPVIPDEWFLVPLEVVKEAIQKIIDGSITEYIYEPSQAKLIKRKNESEEFN